jgi:hypothetical protein
MEMLGGQKSKSYIEVASAVAMDYPSYLSRYEDVDEKIPSRRWTIAERRGGKRRRRRELG